MKSLLFLRDPESYRNDIEFVAYLPKVKGEESLLTAIGQGFKFPDYYGCNWDALFDCLTDLAWIETKGITLVHADLTEISDKDLTIYLEVINDASDSWKHEESHYSKLYFRIRQNRL